MDIIKLARETGVAEIVPVAPRCFEADWPGTDADPFALLPDVRTMLLMVIPYQSFAWKPDEISVNAFYPAFQQGRYAALAVAERLRSEGYSALSAPNLPLKPMAAGTGRFSFGRNCLTGAGEYGTRFTLQCVLTDMEMPCVPVNEARSLARECERCNACVRACPTGAIRGDGTLEAGRCLRNLPYNEPIAKEMRDKAGTSLYGCDICQRVCPRNARQALCEPPDELRSALRLEELLKGNYKPLAPFIGANYARRNRVMGRAALAAGNLRDESVSHLLEEISQNGDSPAREHAAWALGKIQGR